MYSERLQILLSPEQRGRLDQRAKEEGKSVGALVRDAVDRMYPERPSWRPRTREERMKAVEEIKSMRIPGPAPSAEELDRIYEEGLKERWRRAGIRVDD